MKYQNIDVASDWSHLSPLVSVDSPWLRTEPVLKSFLFVNTAFIMICPLLVLQCLLNPRLHQNREMFSYSL